MRVCLFEDQAATLEPLSLTRPVFDLWCGLSRLADKHLRYFSAQSVGALVRPQLADLCQAHHPAWVVNRLDWVREDATVLVNGRWLPPAHPQSSFTKPGVAWVDGHLAYAIIDRSHLEAATSENLLDWLEQWKKVLPHHEAGGTMVTYPWDLIENNAEQITADFPTYAVGQKTVSGLTLVGSSHHVLIDPLAHVEPMVLVDASAGPVVVAAGAHIQAFTRLEGPCYVGPHTQVLSGKIRGGTAIGPHCRVGGEIEASILHGYSNKYHDGFLGHSYVGEWVNLGAGTHSSDLRNDYGEVTVTCHGKSVATGLTKVGCFLGDHTKTGLGTLLNTGTTAGIFCNLLPAGPLAPKYVPSFTSWWNGALRETSEWSRLLETAQTVMERRGCRLTEEHEMLYRHIFAESAADRRRALRDAETRHLRRSA